MKMDSKILFYTRPLRSQSVVYSSEKVTSSRNTFKDHKYYNTHFVSSDNLERF